MGTAGFVILHYGDREITDACVRSVLKMKDLKPWYNVQTATEAFVYFNYFIHITLHP